MPSSQKVFASTKHDRKITQKYISSMLFDFKKQNILQITLNKDTSLMSSWKRFEQGGAIKLLTSILKSVKSEYVYISLWSSFLSQFFVFLAVFFRFSPKNNLV